MRVDYGRELLSLSVRLRTTADRFRCWVLIVRVGERRLLELPVFPWRVKKVVPSRNVDVA